MLVTWTLVVIAVVGIACGCAAILIRRRNLDMWLGSYYFPTPSQPQRPSLAEPLDVFIAVCDHFEPEWNRPGKATSIARVDRWLREYPQLFGQFGDTEGRPPQHTFFYPQDEYAPEYLDRLATLCGTYGDVDIHLHHDGDTADSLREKLEQFKHELFHRHGLLRTDPLTGEIVYGFIHGNWALCNSRPDGRWCGVSQELTVLRETGCYADFTMPSAPSRTQTQIINSIYYAADRPGRCKSHDSGILAQVGCTPPPESLLLIQGPLVLDWRQRKFGLLPRIENGDLQGGRPATWSRLEDWIRAGVHVQGRPNWRFVKLHTHGCNEFNTATLLSSRMQDFHADLARHAQQDPRFRYHYVTAWEMSRLVHAAEANSALSVAEILRHPAASKTAPEKHNRLIATTVG